MCEQFVNFPNPALICAGGAVTPWPWMLCGTAQREAETVSGACGKISCGGVPSPIEERRGVTSGHPKEEPLILDRKIAILGAGKMGETMIGSLLKADVVARENLVATAAHQERLEYIARKFHIATTLKNDEAVRDSQIVLLCVKPQAVRGVLNEIRTALTENHLLISIAASVSTSFMEQILGAPIPVIRTMPNTPCLVGTGMTAICPGKYANHQDARIAQHLFSAVGKTMILDESHMDAVTGLSASGPAFIYIIIESLAEAGVKVGLPRDVATELAAQTVLGSANMVLRTKEHPAKLKDMVTTPAGCTIDGILELEEGKLRVTLIKAVVKATERAKELLD